MSFKLKTVSAMKKYGLPIITGMTFCALSISTGLIALGAIPGIYFLAKNQYDENQRKIHLKE